MPSPRNWPVHYGWKRRTPSAAISTSISWLDPTELKLFDYPILAELLIAYVDDAVAAGNSEALKLLYRRANPD
jgi:hypothetical protein